MYTALIHRSDGAIDAAGRLLITARQRAGLSLRELAQRAGTSHATLSAYEKSRKTPSVATFLRIIDACDMSIDVTLSRRIREADGIRRGDELVQVLELAEQFPVRLSRTLDAPRLASSETRS